MPGGKCGLYPNLEKCREERKKEHERKLTEYAKVAFTDAQEKRIREIVKEEMANFKIDSDCGALIVENRLNQLREKAERS